MFVDVPLTCPEGYGGPNISEEVNPLEVGVGLGNGNYAYYELTHAMYDITSTVSDSAPGGSVFNLSWSWRLGDDVVAFEEVTARLLFNGPAGLVGYGALRFRDIWITSYSECRRFRLSGRIQLAGVS
jgi:hypothetical protein